MFMLRTCKRGSEAGGSVVLAGAAGTSNTLGHSRRNHIAQFKSPDFELESDNSGHKNADDLSYFFPYKQVCK